MLITRLQQYPIPETEPTADWTIYSHFQTERQMNYLIYAVKRDFLSTPATHAVITFSECQDNLINFQQFSSEDYFDWLELDDIPVENGIYQVDTETDNLLILLMNEQLIEISSTSKQQSGLIKITYHQANSSAVLIEQLKNE